MSNLDKDIAAAAAMGISYGKYKLSHPGKPIVKPKPVGIAEERKPDAVCAVCGKPFRKYNPHQRYCDGACREEANRRRSHETYRRNAPLRNEMTCPHCGIVFKPVHAHQVYCEKVCRLEAQNERRKRNYRRKT